MSDDDDDDDDGNKLTDDNNLSDAGDSAPSLNAEENLSVEEMELAVKKSMVSAMESAALSAGHAAHAAQQLKNTEQAAANAAVALKSLEEAKVSTSQVFSDAQQLKDKANEFADSAQNYSELACAAASEADRFKNESNAQANLAIQEQVKANEAANKAEEFFLKVKEHASNIDEELLATKQAAASAIQLHIETEKNARLTLDELDTSKEVSEKAKQFLKETEAHFIQTTYENTRAQEAAKLAKNAKENAESSSAIASKKLEELNKTLENSITATLGGAFQKKSEESRKFDWIWLVVLICGIAGVVCIGIVRYSATENLINQKADISYIALQILINLASISGPIWLSWVATLRLAKTHAITEDYSYKAALAQAYQGYSTSVAEEDEFLKYRLFATVITQLDASPVRFLSERHPATPFQDLLQQPWMEEALKETTFKDQFLNWMKSKFKIPFKPEIKNEN